MDIPLCWAILLDDKTDLERFNLFGESSYVLNGEDKGNVTLIDHVFETENITALSFVRNNIPYLDFPLWLAESNQDLREGSEKCLLCTSEGSTQPRRLPLTRRHGF